MQKVTQKELEERFVGRNVRITHTGNVTLGDHEGQCTAIYVAGGGFDIELDGSARHGFLPETLTETTVEGPLGLIAGQRRIEVV